MDRSFLKFSLAAMASMFLGSHVVYTIYQPMADFDDYVRREQERRTQLKIQQQTAINTEYTIKKA